MKRLVSLAERDEKQSGFVLLLNEWTWDQL